MESQIKPDAFLQKPAGGHYLDGFPVRAVAFFRTGHQNTSCDHVPQDKRGAIFWWPSDPQREEGCRGQAPSADAATDSFGS